MNTTYNESNCLKEKHPNEITFYSLYRLVLKKKSKLIWGQVVTMIAIVISIPIPLMLPVLVDEVVLEKPAFFVETIERFIGSGDALYYIGIVVFSVIILRILHFVFSVIITKIFTDIAKFVTFHIRKISLKHLAGVSMNEYESLGSGAVTSILVTDVNTIDNFIISSASKFFSSVLTLLAVAVVMIAIDPVLGILILISQPLIMILSKRISKKTGDLKKQENKSVEEFQENTAEVLELFGQIKASNKEALFFDTLLEFADKVRKRSYDYSYRSVSYEKFSYTLFLALFELLRAAGLLLVVYSDLSIGMMFAMFGYIWFMLTPVQDLLSMQYSYASASAALKRINKILELHQEKQGVAQLDGTEKGVDIELKNLNFSYDHTKPLLRDITLTIKAGTKAAIIGASGSGKTTLAQVISGFYEKSNGEILYNGISIQELDKHSLRSQLFLILQMPLLFNNTLRFNITMGNSAVCDSAIEEALCVAQLSDFLESLPHGLDTIVGRHGIRLSGGQRQRISIARMLIADTPVVIFDESTSALDVHTECKLFESLKKHLESKTVITIAHRLSTLKNAQMVYVLDGGKVVEQGTHDELEENEGHYTQFVKNQML